MHSNQRVDCHMEFSKISDHNRESGPPSVRANSHRDPPHLVNRVQLLAPSLNTCNVFFCSRLRIAILFVFLVTHASHSMQTEPCVTIVPSDRLNVSKTLLIPFLHRRSLADTNKSLLACSRGWATVAVSLITRLMLQHQQLLCS